MSSVTLQYTTSLFNGVIRLVKAVARPFISLFDVIEKTRVINMTYKELNKMTDRELKDIGIGRSQIMEIAYTAAYGERK